MKRILRMLLVLALVLCLLPMAVSAVEEINIRDSGSCGDGVTWILTYSGELIISGSGNMDDYNPDTNPAPWSKAIGNVEKIIIEDGVTYIGDYAFYGYLYLNELNLGSVEIIGDYAFYQPYDHMGYPDLTFPASVTQIGSFCFAGHNAEAMHFAGDMPAFGVNALQNVSSAICYPSDNGTWDKAAVKEAGSKVVPIPCGANGFEYKGFGGDNGNGVSYWCYNDLDNTLWIAGWGEMYDYTFRTDSPWVDEGYDEIIQRVIIDDCITSIGNWSFALCYSLREVEIPDSVTDIGEYAFRCCGLESVEIPAKVNGIGECAFISCDNLATVVFEGSAPELHYDSFKNTVANAWYPAGNSTWNGWNTLNLGGYLNWNSYTPDSKPAPGLAQKPAYDFGDVQWSFDNGTLTFSGVGPMFSPGLYDWENIPWYQHQEDTVRVVIGNGITSISNEAFSNFRNLEAVEIASSVKAIGGNAFQYCFALESVSMADGLAVIQESAFASCGALTQIHIPDTVTYLGNYALSGCSNLVDVHLPESLTVLNEGVLTYIGATEVTVPAGVRYVGSVVVGESNVKNLYFAGNAPGFHENAFARRRLTVWYPENDPTWTSAVMQSYGGSITWLPYDAGISQQIPGDMDGDGVLDDKDVAQLLWHTLFPNAFEIQGNADFTGDGVVDDADVAYLLWHTLFPDAFPLN